MYMWAPPHQRPRASPISNFRRFLTNLPHNNQACPHLSHGRCIFVSGSAPSCCCSSSTRLFLRPRLARINRAAPSIGLLSSSRRGSAPPSQRRTRKAQAPRRPACACLVFVAPRLARGLCECVSRLQLRRFEPARAGPDELDPLWCRRPHLDDAASVHGVSASRPGLGIL